MRRQRTRYAKGNPKLERSLVMRDTRHSPRLKDAVFSCREVSAPGLPGGRIFLESTTLPLSASERRCVFLPGGFSSRILEWVSNKESGIKGVMLNAMQAISITPSLRARVRANLSVSSG